MDLSVGCANVRAPGFARFFASTLNNQPGARLIPGEEVRRMECPICKVDRPAEVHLEWCTYDGPEPAPDDED